MPAAIARTIPLPQRLLFALLVAASLIAAFHVVTAFSRPDHLERPPQPIHAGTLSDLPLRQPKPIADAKAWVVRLDETHVIAMSWKDPHLGATVPWRPDFAFEGTKGWFRNPSSGGTFDIEGHCHAFCVSNLRRLPVQITSSGRIYVDPTPLKQNPLIETYQYPPKNH